MLGSSQRAELGRAAVDAGCVDRDRDDDRAAATDTIANVLHYLAGIGEAEPELVLSSAATHYFAERQGHRASAEREPRRQR